MSLLVRFWLFVRYRAMACCPEGYIDVSMRLPTARCSLVTTDCWLLLTAKLTAHCLLPTADC